MKKSTLALFSADEVDLLRSTSEHQLSRLDEDELLELHQRVRRARNKYSKLHRRQARAQVSADGGRGKAAKKNNRTAEKAEVFEEALERVSVEVAAAAAASAARLREERIAAARGERSSGAPTAGGSKTGGSKNRRAATASPRDIKIAASGRAAGKRRQAKRDSKR